MIYFIPTPEKLKSAPKTADFKAVAVEGTDTDFKVRYFDLHGYRRGTREEMEAFNSRGGAK